jgi:CRISPR-associated endoribonuclease Cas6
MRLFIKLEFDKIILPIHYKHIQQGLVYNWINDLNYQKFLHDTGFKIKNANYKMFTFSKFFGKTKYDSYSKLITFYDHIWFTLSSHDDKFLEYIIDKILFEENYKLIDQNVKVTSIKYDKFYPEKKIKVKTKSPITAHISFKMENKTKTHFFGPMEEEFGDIIRKNLIKKYEAYYGVKPENTDFSISPVGNNLKEVISKYKNFVIKGWEGEFVISGSPELLRIGYDAGFGARNSMGFGLVERVRA